MSSNRRLAILWNALIGATGSRDADGLDQFVGALEGLPVAGEVAAQRDLALALAGRQHQRRRPAPAAPAGCRRSASRCPGCRRRSRRCGSAGTRTAGTSRPAAAPARPARAPPPTGSARRRCRCCRRRPRTAAVPSSRSMPMVRAARACRMFSSTPQSVEPASTRAVGFSASRSSASARSAGRANAPWSLVTLVAAGAGAGRACRANSGSDSAGGPSAYAASRIGR